MTVALIDYGAGNLRSVAKALEAAGAQKVLVTSKPEDALVAERIVLPGVGAFGHCAEALRAIDGMEDALNEAVRVKGKPFLGICVGMQLLAEEGHEFGIHKGLGWVRGAVRKMTPGGHLKVPQIGWNEVLPTRDGLIERGYAYFVHSYALQDADPEQLAAEADYGTRFTAAVQKDTCLGVQFHPEKSQAYGLSLLNRWLDWRP